MTPIESKRKELEDEILKTNRYFIDKEGWFWIRDDKGQLIEPREKDIRNIINLGVQMAQEQKDREFVEKIKALDCTRMGDHEKWKELKQSLGEKRQ